MRNAHETPSSVCIKMLCKTTTLCKYRSRKRNATIGSAFHLLSSLFILSRIRLPMMVILLRLLLHFHLILRCIELSSVHIKCCKVIPVHAVHAGQGIFIKSKWTRWRTGHGYIGGKDIFIIVGKWEIQIRVSIMVKCW